MDVAQSEADRNYEAFLAILPKLGPEMAGKYALLHGGEVVEYYDQALPASLEGLRRFGQARFSVQEVAAKPENLGFYSYVGGAGQC